MKKSLFPVALYLPQFHPIPENDEWWGKGFTEWRNVTRAKPLFDQHYQPHLPADLGFYDLRLKEVMQQQIDLARKNHLGGFCFYHYWFNGKRLLEKPVEQLMADKDLDFPFMLCWANENWTRRWDGLEHEILMEQKYAATDDEDHIRHLIPVLKDERYIKVNGKSVFVVYKPFLLPNPTETANTWRRIAAEYDVELYLCHMVFGYREDQNLIAGFDAAIDFEPFGIRHENVFSAVHAERGKRQSSFAKFFRNIELSLKIRLKKPKKQYNTLPYSYYLENSKPMAAFPFKLYPMVVPSWDNTARKPDNPSLVLTGSTPEKFKQWLDAVKNDFVPYSENENFIFINAWNEWAEGNHLEPDIKFGHGYLEAVRSSFSN
ncbi:MAG: glycosyl hydrolase [Azospira oryzae]|nr:MAG: glycosyl hydrolase [Azospira oryzae]